VFGFVYESVFFLGLGLDINVGHELIKYVNLSKLCNI